VKTVPELFVIAGPNGAGKTTFAREYLPHFAKCREFVNADLIAGGLSLFSPGTAAIAAGRIMLEKIGELAARRPFRAGARHQEKVRPWNGEPPDGGSCLG
jgi:predicted ABC-type ATPase